MKKILNLLAAVSLVATGSAAVVACGSGTHTPSTKATNEVNKIKKALGGKTLQTYYDKNSPKPAQAKSELNNALLRLVPTLTQTELNNISYSGDSALNVNQPVAVTLKVAVAGSTASLPIKAEMLKQETTSQDIATNINKSVTATNPITVKYNDNTPQTIKGYNGEIQQYLVSHNFVAFTFWIWFCC